MTTNSTPKPHRLTFRLASLEPVRSGEKTCTIHLSQRAWTIRAGDRLALCFGRYDKPVVIEAVASRVEHISLEAKLKHLNAEVDYIEALLKHGVLTLDELNDLAEEPDEDLLLHEGTRDGMSRILREALEAAGGNYQDILEEMLERQLGVIHCIWWTLEPPKLTN